MTAVIRSIGTALPPFSIDQSDAALIAQKLHVTERWHAALPKLYRRSGVQRRSSVLLLNDENGIEGRQTFYEVRSEQHPFGPSTSQRMKAYQQLAGPLLEQAVLQSLQGARLAASQVTHLITVSCTGFCSPGIDHWLMEKLGMNPNVSRTHVGFMGCHALINALRVAASICNSDPNARVVVCAVELCSLHQQYSEDAEQLVANSLFADGAASLVIVGDALQESPCNRYWRLGGSLSWLFAKTIDKMGWKIGDHGFEMQLSPSVPSLIEKHLRPPIEEWLSNLSLPINQVDHWVIHPGGPRILDAVGGALGLETTQYAQSNQVLSEHGNMSSPTIAFILKRYCVDHMALEGSKHAVLVAFGPGLHAEAVLLST